MNGLDKFFLKAHGYIYLLGLYIPFVSCGIASINRGSSLGLQGVYMLSMMYAIIASLIPLGLVAVVDKFAEHASPGYEVNRLIKIPIRVNGFCFFTGLGVWAFFGFYVGYPNDLMQSLSMAGFLLMTPSYVMIHTISIAMAVFGIRGKFPNSIRRLFKPTW